MATANKYKLTGEKVMNKQNSTLSINDMWLELEDILDNINDEIEDELALEKILDEAESKVIKLKRS